MNWDSIEESFWIQVHDLPLGMLSSEYATDFAKSLGKLIELDCVGEGAQTDRDFLRFRVEIDISKPLVPGFYIERSDGTESWVSLKYERLSDFCYRCGCLGHGRDSCTNEVIAKFAGKWSSEMRAKTLFVHYEYRAHGRPRFGVSLGLFVDCLNTFCVPGCSSTIEFQYPGPDMQLLLKFIDSVSTCTYPEIRTRISDIISWDYNFEPAGSTSISFTIKSAALKEAVDDLECPGSSIQITLQPTPPSVTFEHLLPVQDARKSAKKSNISFPDVNGIPQMFVTS